MFGVSKSKVGEQRQMLCHQSQNLRLPLYEEYISLEFTLRFASIRILSRHQLLFVVRVESCHTLSAHRTKPLGRILLDPSQETMLFNIFSILPSELPVHDQSHTM